MAEQPPVIDPKHELPAPHDMQLTVKHWQKLPKPGAMRAHPWIKGSIAFVLVSLLLAAFSFVFFFLGAETNEPQTINPTQTPSPTTNPLETLQTYNGDGFSFQFNYLRQTTETGMYPITWSRDVVGAEMVPAMYLLSQDKPFSAPKTNREIQIGKSSGTVETVDEEKTLTIEGRTVQYYIISCGLHCYYGIIDFSSNNTYYRLMNNIAGGGLSHRFDNIIATLTFKTSTQNIPIAIQLARTALAKKLQVDETDVMIEQTDGREWSDSSLGCPEPGKMYLQVITPGYQIRFNVNGKQYTYNTDQNSSFVTCEN